MMVVGDRVRIPTIREARVVGLTGSASRGVGILFRFYHCLHHQIACTTANATICTATAIAGSLPQIAQTSPAPVQPTRGACSLRETCALVCYRSLCAPIIRLLCGTHFPRILYRPLWVTRAKSGSGGIQCGAASRVGKEYAMARERRTGQTFTACHAPGTSNFIRCSRRRTPADPRFLTP